VTVWAYALTDPITHEHRYIGSSYQPEKRLVAHLSDSRRGLNAGAEKIAWLRSLLERNLEPGLELLESAPTRADGARLEALWIRECRTRGCPLLNTMQPSRNLPRRVDDQTRRCSISGCTESHVALGWCRVHYDKAKRHDGDVAFVRPPKYVKPRPLTAEEKFWAKVDQDPRHGGCWTWGGTTNPANGFGVCGFVGYPKYAHQLAHVLVVGPLPRKPRILVNHCGNRACCRPDAEHWQIGTRSEMALLRERRYPLMREVRHEARRSKAIGWDEVREIRRLRATERPSYRVLAERFGVSQSLIQKICANQTRVESESAAV
jgi:hypothetical protein